MNQGFLGRGAHSGLGAAAQGRPIWDVDAGLRSAAAIAACDSLNPAACDTLIRISLRRVRYDVWASHGGEIQLHAVNLDELAVRQRRSRRPASVSERMGPPG